MVLQFLARSPTRVAVLSAVADEPKRLRAINEAIDEPRTTIRDNIAKLRENDLIREDHNRQYAATTTGRLVLESYQDCLEEVTVIERLDPFLKHVSASPLPDSLETFAEMELAVPTADDPHRATTEFAEIIAEGDRVQGFLPSTPPQISTAVLDTATASPSSVTLLLSQPAFTMLKRHSEMQVADMPTQNCLLETDQSFPFGLVLTDDQVALCAFDDDMITRATVHTADEAAREWASETFESNLNLYQFMSNDWGGLEEPTPED